MDDRWIGSLIRTLRLQKDWSQEGLCSGICAVSYLSKIEQGKADCSPEVRRLLLTKLCGYWFEDTDGALRACTDAVWDSILQMDQRALDVLVRVGVTEIVVADMDGCVRMRYAVKDLCDVRTALGLEAAEQLAVSGEHDPITVVSEDGVRRQLTH